jgi:hypothetical protein
VAAEYSPQIYRAGINAIDKTSKKTTDKDGDYSTLPLIQISWDGEPSVYAGDSDNWIFLWKKAKLAV